MPKNANKKQRQQPKTKPKQRRKKKASKSTLHQSRRAHRAPRVGEKIGAFLGGAAQTALGTIFGMGEYHETLGNELGVPASEISSNEQPEVNSLIEPSNTDVVSHMHTDTEGCVRITRREFVELIDIKDSDTLYELVVEPGRKTFPWLSSISANWQQYQVLGLAFEYVPTSGAAVASDSGALGQVVMAFKYDVTQAPFAYPGSNLTGLLNQSGAVSTSPASPATCFMECDPTLTNQYTKYIRRADSGFTSYSEQNFAAATLMILTSGAQNLIQKQAGQLWVTYDIVLIHPTTVPVFPLLQRVLNDSVYTKYAPLWDRLAQLYDHSGPYTQDEFIARSSMMEVLLSQLKTPELQQKQALWRVLAEATQLADTPGAVDYPLLDYIHSSPLYRAAIEVNPERPDSVAVASALASPTLERWETVSNRGA